MSKDGKYECVYNGAYVCAKNDRKISRSIAYMKSRLLPAHSAYINIMVIYSSQAAAAAF